MKIKRYKKAGSYMKLYKNNFGFREPYQVLLDGTFCQVALDHKVNIQEQLPRYLGGDCKLLTTACVIEETKRLGQPLRGANLIVSQFPVHNCGHDEPVSASKCLSTFMIDSRNRDHYLVATQDHKLNQKISKEVICPIIKLANNALVLEKPPKKVQDRVSRRLHNIAATISEDAKVKLEKFKDDEDLKQPEPKLRKRRGPKGPNPLSCKKKKTSAGSKKITASDSNEENNKRRRRKRPQIAKHVKKLLNESSGTVG